jgi:hypothetical protein
MIKGCNYKVHSERLGIYIRCIKHMHHTHIYTTPYLTKIILHIYIQLTLKDKELYALQYPVRIDLIIYLIYILTLSFN